MKLVSAEAQVLSVRDLQEADRIVAILTAEHGKVRGVAKGSKRKFSRFAAPLHPLAKVEASWMEKESNDLVRFSALDLLRPAENLQSDLEDILLSSYIADHVETFAQERDRWPEFYRLLNSVVEALLEGADRATSARYFELWALRLAGLLPEPGGCHNCGEPLGRAATIEEEGFACINCRPQAEESGSVIGRESLGFVALSRSRAVKDLAAMEWPSEVTAEVESMCAKIRQRFLQTELRSYRVLRDILQEATSC